MADKDDPTPTVKHTDVYTNVQNNGAGSELDDVDITYTHDSGTDEAGANESRDNDTDI